MKRLIAERIRIELDQSGYVCRDDGLSDLCVYRGEPAAAMQDPVASVRILENERSVRVWFMPGNALMKEEIRRKIIRAVRPDGWRLYEAAGREETRVNPGRLGLDPADPELPSNPAGTLRRFRAARYLALFAYLLLALFFGMLLNLRTSGWIGTAILLILAGILSGKASSRGCLPTLLVWVVGLLGILVVFALTIQI